MGDRGRWTLVVVPPGTDESKSLRVPLLVLRIALTSIAAIALITLVLSYTTASKVIALQQLDRLERRSVLLADELTRTRALLDEVTDTIEAITVRDGNIRLLAGLEPTDPDVQLAGIGGPVGRWTEEERILAEDPTGRGVLKMRTDLGSLIRRANFLAKSFEAARDTLESHVDRLLRTPSTWPTKGWYTSRFSRARMHPIHGEERPHKGIDIAAPMGTPIVAPAKGRVKEIRTSKGYGLMVVVDHGRGVVTRYAHCSKVLVEVGQSVVRGDDIALIGMTGIATAPHLHYEVLVRNRAVDPYMYILEEEDVIVD